MKHSRVGAFGLSLGISLFVLLTGVGCVVVDYQGRKMSFGDTQPPLQVEELPGGKAELEVKLFGWEDSVDFTFADKAYHFLWEFLCLPH